MALINCKECGREISDTADSCPHCGYREKIEEVECKTEQPEVLQSEIPQEIHPDIQQQVQPNVQQQIQVENQQQVLENVQQTTQMNAQQIQPIVQSVKKNFLNNKGLRWSIIVVVIALIIGVVIASIIYKKYQYNNLPIKVDISMTSYYGDIEEILDELGLDTDLVTMGANCYTGVQRNEFSTTKYGILHTEFRYCALNETLVFRVYNDEKDQPLRDPKPGELPLFDKYGELISSGNSF